MDTSEKFCLKWNDFESNLSEAFRDIREEKDFFDVTLSCGTQHIQAHKVVLSACSPFFRSVLKQNPHQHPLLYLKGVQFNNLLLVLNFIYNGEANVAQDDLNSFLAVAEDLEIKGLTQNDSKTKTPEAISSSSKGISSTPRNRQRPFPVAISSSDTGGKLEEPLEEIEEITPAPAIKSEPLSTSYPLVSHSTTPVVDSYATTDRRTHGTAATGVTDFGDTYAEESYFEDHGYGEYETAGYSTEGGKNLVAFKKYNSKYWNRFVFFSKRNLIKLYTPINKSL